MVSPYTNPSEKRGATLNTHFIVDGRTTSLRSLWERGILVPRERLVQQGNPPFPHTVTVYEAEFTDRNRSLLISPETYDFMLGLRDNDLKASNVLSEEEERLVQAPNLPDRQEAKETFWYGVDDHRSVPDPESIYDLAPREVEEDVPEEVEDV